MTSRLLTRNERIELRHRLQELSEHARTVRNAMDPYSGMMTVTDTAWLEQWNALTANLDAITNRITGNGQAEPA